MAISTPARPTGPDPRVDPGHAPPIGTPGIGPSVDDSISVTDHRPIPAHDCIPKAEVRRRAVSKRTQAEAALRANDERFRAQYQGIPIPSYSWQRVGDALILVDYNVADEAITHGAVKDMVGSTATAMYRERPAIVQSLWDCIEQRTTTVSEMRYEFFVRGELKELAVYYVFVPRTS